MLNTRQSTQALPVVIMEKGDDEGDWLEGMIFIIYPRGSLIYLEFRKQNQESGNNAF